MSGEYKDWDVTRTVELSAPAAKVWEDVGGFFNIHTWHPDISKTENVSEQFNSQAIRRQLTFPGQPVTVEQLVMMDNENFHYKYKWHKGEWGEQVKNYHAQIRVLALDLDEKCVVQWSSTFSFPEDAISTFYQNGFRSLVEKYN